MHVPVVALMLFGAFVTPLVSHRLFENLFDWERDQISVDNGAIVAGGLQVGAMRILARAQKQLDRLERAHHPVHLAARAAPLTAPVKVLDRSLEFAIATLVRTASAAAWVCWKRAALEGTRAVLTLAKTGSIRTPPRFPVRPKRCSICRLQNGWSVDRSASRRSTASVFRTGGVRRARIDLKGDRITGPWAYQLLDERFEP